jgi:hypothetical protein
VGSLACARNASLFSASRYGNVIGALGHDIYVRAYIYVPSSAATLNDVLLGAYTAATAGGFTLGVDGPITIDGQALTKYSDANDVSIATLAFGIFDNGAAQPSGEAWFDDILVDTQPVTCEQ